MINLPSRIPVKVKAFYLVLWTNRVSYQEILICLDREGHLQSALNYDVWILEPSKGTHDGVRCRRAP